jgi:GTP pyrophosphokinase
MIRQYELVERVRTYDPAVDEDALNRAYVFSMKVHGSQKRASGDPYFSHPLEVAGILTQFKLDSASIVTALLHDTVEDTLTTIEEIERLFGTEVGRLVDGVTKLSRLELQSDQSRQAENFRKLVIAMSEDIRLLLVKLADRLHNMRTLHHIGSADKRVRIARETMDIYAPLAERIGMRTVQEELEDLAFAQINPDARDSIIARLKFLRERGGDIVTRITDQLKRVLAEDGVQVWVSGREKTPHSVWRKMQKKNVGFEQLSDVMAFRIVVENVSDCYRALGTMHSRYPVVPGRFKDYISTPKPNGYRSLHTGVFGPEQQRIEVQIRTREMHEIAEYGVAAHWKYKGAVAQTDGKQYRWLRELLDILDHAGTPEEFLEHTKLAMFQDQVFCFTPKGDLIALPQGATPVDFAYAVHSEVGDATVGAKVNGRLVPLRTKLSHGDQVEVITSKGAAPSAAWERFVVTGKARSRIRRYLRSQRRNDYIAHGRELLQRAGQRERLKIVDKRLEPLLAGFQQKSVEDLLAAIGEGSIGPRLVVEALRRGEEPDRPEPAPGKVVPLRRLRAAPAALGWETRVQGLLPGLAVSFARCCHPIPGDPIVGVVRTGRGITIHRSDCATLARTAAEEEDRWLDLGWNHLVTGIKGTARLQVMTLNQPGSLGSLSTVIGREGGNITDLRFGAKSDDLYEIVVDVEVDDRDHMDRIMAGLRASPVVTAVERMQG